jgi:hypothetical protein
MNRSRSCYRTGGCWGVKVDIPTINGWSPTVGIRMWKTSSRQLRSWGFVSYPFLTSATSQSTFRISSTTQTCQLTKASLCWDMLCPISDVYFHLLSYMSYRTVIASFRSSQAAISSVLYLTLQIHGHLLSCIAR